MDWLIVILLLVFGVILLLAELFLLPGFGIAGISGFICLIAGVAWAYVRLAPVYPWAGHLILAATLLLILVSIIIFIKSRAIDKMALDTAIDSKVELAAPGKKIENLEAEAKKMEKLQ
ncbi:MAG: hypothetical protein MJZ82_04350 [Paludibacteraceae bacterium]|nr:hypothetical protein [Paludibacteraceae bacterium]